MMPLADILFLTIVVYLLYRFIYNFLLPVVRATRHVREQFRNMQGPRNGTSSQPGGFSQSGGSQRPGGSSQPGGSSRPDGFSQPGASQAGGTAANKQRSSKPPAEDYIDFEEIK